MDLSGKVCLVTGASSGLGQATAEALARLGAKVWLLVRNEAKGQRVVNEIKHSTGNEKVLFGIADLSDLTTVREFVDRFQYNENRLDVLINNAGTLLSEKGISPDGFDLSFTTNVLGPFLLTNLLIPMLKTSNPSRIINISSGGMYSQKLDVEELMKGRRPFDGVKAYAQAKRAQVILTELWAEELAGTGVTVNAMHPGWVDTPGLQSSLPTFHRLLKRSLRNLEQGTDTIIWLTVASSIARLTGKFWFDRRQRATHILPGTKSSLRDRQLLWDTCTQLCIQS